MDVHTNIRGEKKEEQHISIIPRWKLEFHSNHNWLLYIFSGNFPGFHRLGPVKKKKVISEFG